MLTVKEVFHLSNRAAEGLVRSRFALMHMALSVPDHSTLSRRECMANANGKRGNKIKECEVRYVIRQHIQDETEAERIFELVKNQSEY